MSKILRYSALARQMMIWFLVSSFHIAVLPQLTLMLTNVYIRCVYVKANPTPSAYIKKTSIDLSISSY
nr:MAG: hypothetical protein [Sanya fiers-like virus 14]